MPVGNDNKVLIGEPVDAAIDVGAAVRNGQAVQVRVYSGNSVLDAGEPTGETVTIGRILSPLTQNEVGTIRCIGLNVSCWPVRRGKEETERAVNRRLLLISVQETRGRSQNGHSGDSNSLFVREPPLARIMHRKR